MIEYWILLLYNKEIHLFKKHMATLISVSDIIHAKSVDIRQTHTWKAVVYNVDFLYCPTYMFWHPWLPIDNKQIQPRYLKQCQINSKKLMQTNYQITVFMLFQFFIFTHFTVISDSPWNSHLGNLQQLPKEFGDFDLKWTQLDKFHFEHSDFLTFSTPYRPYKNESFSSFINIGRSMSKYWIQKTKKQLPNPRKFMKILSVPWPCSSDVANT